MKPSKSMVSNGFNLIAKVGAKAAAGANSFMDLEKNKKVAAPPLACRFIDGHGQDLCCRLIVDLTASGSFV